MQTARPFSLRKSTQIIRLCRLIRQGCSFRPLMVEVSKVKSARGPGKRLSCSHMAAEVVQLYAEADMFSGFSLGEGPFERR